jgi:hypothetical protein
LRATAFRRERRAADVLNPGYVLAFAAFRDPELGLNAELSRLVRAADGTAVYLVPGDDVVAIIQRGGSGSVLGLSQALDGTGISTSFRGTSRLQIVGLLPDDVHMVSVARRNGDEIDVRVPDHLYSADVHASAPEELPAVVRFDLDGREQRLEFRARTTRYSASGRPGSRGTSAVGRLLVWTTCERVVRPGADDCNPLDEAGTDSSAARTPPGRPKRA